MKVKVNVYRNNLSGTIEQVVKDFAPPNWNEPNQWQLLGTTEIEVEAVKREVTEEAMVMINLDEQIIQDTTKIYAYIPKDSYEPKLTYKVKR